MAYNKARAEKEWLEWKSDEETKLRKLGVDEDTIQRLHTYDWETFKADRKYQERNMGSDMIADEPDGESFPILRSVSQLLNEIDDERLYSILNETDDITLKILLMRMDGYESEEIAHKLDLSVTAVDSRVWRLKKKIEKNLK